MIRRPPRSTPLYSSAASDVYKRQCDQRLRAPYGHRRGGVRSGQSRRRGRIGVVGFPHEIKGQGIYAYVTLNAGVEPTEALRDELVKHVRKEIGPIATPDFIQWAPALPKTRSGKIMRRILRKIAADEVDELGDVSTLADPSVVEHLVENRSGNV